MFEDRSKNGYNFEKLDKTARTQVITEEKTEKSEAHKKLFGAKEVINQTELKQEVKQEILNKNKEEKSIETLPSSNYLKSFENQTIPDDVPLEEVKEDVKDINAELLIESSNDVEIDNKIVNKELKNASSKPKKNYSFRIKLVAGVYCIVVALFGGWVISNVVNINNVSSNIQQATQTTAEINNNIIDIVSKIKGIDNATGNPDEDTGLVEIITKEIDVTPEKVVEPNQYEESSNWFDALCNWISGIFGG